MLKPNFFIVGAPKSGTTALYDYLKKHPQVYLPKKEICFFSPDLSMRTPHLRESVYLSYYTDAKNQKAVVVMDLFTTCSLQRLPQKLKAFNPDAKIISYVAQPCANGLFPP